MRSRVVCTENVRLIMLVVMLSLFPAMTSAADINDPNASGGEPLLEVKVLSLQLSDKDNGHAVVRHCVRKGKCNKITFLIDSDTELADNGEPISLRQAVQLQWEYAVLRLKKSNKAQMFVRVPKLY